MKLFSLRGIVCVLIVAACVAYAYKKSSDSPLGADEGSQCVEDILKDPLFKIADDASPKDVASAAYNLCLKLDALNEKIAKTIADNNPRNRSKRDPIDPHKSQKKNDNTEKFYKRFEEVFVPKLAQIVANDEITDLMDETSENALRVYLPYQVHVGNIDELAKIHERELLRYRKAIRSDDWRVKKQAFDRLTRVDRYYLNVKEFVWDGYRLVSDATKRQFSDFEYYLIMEFGNQIAEELKRDPYLVLNANSCYLILLHNGYDDAAVELREKFVAAIDPETAVRAVRDQGIMANIQLSDVSFYHDDAFDDSIFDIPEDASQSDCVSLANQIDFEVSIFLDKPTSQRKRNEIFEKTKVAKTQIAVHKIAYYMTERNGGSIQEEDELKNARLTAKTAHFLRKQIDAETQKPLDKINVRFADLARAPLLAYNLEEAALSGDADAIADACDNFVRRANKSDVAAERLLLEADSYAQSNPEVAAALLDRALDEATNSIGKLSVNAVKLRKIKDSLSPED